MKYYEMERSSAGKVQKAGAREDIFFRDEGDDRVDPRFMLLPLLILQGLTFLSVLL